MGTHRQLVRHRFAAALLIAAALLVRLIVPTGYMLDASHGAITVELCSGTGPMRMAMPGMTHPDDGKGHGKAGSPCAFAGLAAPALGGADPILLAVAIAFIMATAFDGGVAAPPLRRLFLRPPLRGPPTAS